MLGVNGLGRFKQGVFKIFLLMSIDRLRVKVILKRAHPWQFFAKEIQSTIKVVGLLLNRQHAVSLSTAKIELIGFNSIKINGNDFEFQLSILA